MASLNNEQDDVNGWDEFLFLLKETVHHHSEQINGKPRYLDDGRDTISMTHVEWRQIKSKLDEMGVTFPDLPHEKE